MKSSSIAGFYSLLIGLTMIAMWIMFIIGDAIPELSSKPLEIFFHILAEFLTALLLIVGGIGLLQESTMLVRVYYLGTGMLLYSIKM